MAGFMGNKAGPGEHRDGGGRDVRLADFAQGGRCDGIVPSASLGLLVDDLSGPGRRCDDATDDETLGLLRGWKSMESWTAAGKLGVLREMIRRHPLPGTGGTAGDLPVEWEGWLEHEVSVALGMSLVGTRKLMRFAWALEARVPNVGRALADGLLDYGRARLIVEETDVLLGMDKLALAERMILAGLGDCKTWADLLRLVQRVVCTVDPEGVEKRRKHAERQAARVQFWRESSGTCALAGYSLPTDEALAANANVEARAQEYRRAGVRRYIDILRVMAYLDILNGIPVADRVARVLAEHAAETDADNTDAAETDADNTATAETDAAGAAGAGAAAGADAAAGTGEAGMDSAGATGAAPDDNIPGSAAPSGPALPARANLTLPLADLLGLAERSGEAWGLGALDPGLVRDLATVSARSPDSEFCVTITSQDGYAIGHGCCKPLRPRRSSAGGKAPPRAVGSGTAAHGTADRVTFTPGGRPGPAGGYGSWILTLPGARHAFTVDIDVVPVFGCDHRHESKGYEPSARLRHLIQVRDGKCSFPTCSRHARETDLEHATPHDKGGRTCGCNCHSCSRTCHQVKQQPGWNVTELNPGWHQWTTPSGRVYVQGPWKYPA